MGPLAGTALGAERATPAAKRPGERLAPATPSPRGVFPEAIDDTPIDPDAVESGEAGWFPHPIYGPYDELGALNEITPQKVAEALRILDLTRPLKIYELGEFIYPGFPAFGDRVYKQRIVPSIPEPLGENRLWALEERIETTYQLATQIDALCHISVGKTFYNGFKLNDLVGTDDPARFPDGVRHLGFDRVRPFITRGIVLDIVGLKVAKGETSALSTTGEFQPILRDNYRITVEDMQEAMEREGIREIRPGDVVILRTGWTHLADIDPERYLAGEPGIYLREARWLAQFRPAIVASDTWGLEVLPPPIPEHVGKQVFPVHQVLIVQHGIYIGESFITEELVQDGVYEFVFFYTHRAARGKTCGEAAPGGWPTPRCKA